MYLQFVHFSNIFMVERLPTLPLYKALTAIYTGIMACLCSWAVFIMPHGEFSNITVLVPIWALVSSFLNISDNYDQSLRSITGALIGLAFSELIGVLVTVCSHTGYNEYIGLILAFPICFLMGIADPATGCKLCKVFRSDVAKEAMYIPLAFPGGSPYIPALLTAGSFIIGSVESMLATTALNAFNLLPRREVEPIPQFAARAADYYETLSTYCTSGLQHAKFIDRQRAVFEDAWRAASRAARTPQLRSVIYRMAAELIALRTTLRDGAYSPGILENIWQPLVPNLMNVRSGAVYWLRTVGDSNPLDQFRPDELVNLSEQVNERLNEQSVKYSQMVMAGKSSLSTADDIVRFQFTMSLLSRFAVLTSELCELVIEQQKLNPDSTSTVSYRAAASAVHGFFQFNWLARLRCYYQECKAYWVEWWHLPFFAYGKLKLKERLVHPLRLSITISAFAFPLIAWAYKEPIIEFYGFWALVPLLFCFLDTPGASLIKGTRRIVGTILAATIAIICVAIHPTDKAAFVVELFVITTIGKLGSLYESIGYGGLVFAFTWMIVGIIPTLGIIPGQTREGMILWACWRLGLTLLGTIGGIIVSTFIFPSFAMDKLDKESAHEIIAQADLVVSSIEELRSVGQDGVNCHQSARRLMDGDKFFESFDLRLTLTPEARAEALVLDKTAFVDDTTRTILGAQEHINTMGRTSLMAYTSVTGCSETVSSPSTEVFLEPLRFALRDLAEAIRDSASKVVLKVVDGPQDLDELDSFESCLVGSQVNVAMQRVVDIFVAKRQELLAADHPGEVRWDDLVNSGLYSLYHAIYSLRVFVDDWVWIESAVLGLKPVVRARSRALSGAPWTTPV